MQTACKEMRHIIDRTAQNYLIGQLHDVSVGIWDAGGNTLAIPVGLVNQFLGTSYAVRSIVEKFRGNLAPGDVLLTNDPYHGGHNTHLPDWGFFRPIFYRGELLFFTLARAHQQDTGGAYPGGYFPNGYDNYAMIAATRVCEQRLTALLDRYGRETVLACTREMLDRTERAVRQEIRG